MRVTGRWLLRTSLAGLALTAGAWLLCPQPSLYGDKGFSAAVFDREDRLLRLTLAPDERYRLFTPLAEIAPAAVAATLAYEDEHFFRHPGVNPVSLVRAAWTTYVARERTVGGSTLTMQLARLRFGIDSSSPGGKLVQIARALQLERHYSKRELLEAYLNLAPYGGNVEGLGTASRVYFDKSADGLSLPEALTLAVIPQDPTARRPGPAGEPAELVAARRRAFELWRARRPEAPAPAIRPDAALATRSVDRLPFRAPHFVDMVLAGGDRGRVRTTLDPALQALAEARVRDYVARRREDGIRNAAALIVDHRDIAVRALVGSADWHDDAIEGQVNGVTAPRSPGSALKPFIYGLALDQGLIHPMTLMKDAPARYGTYTPENFDRGFTGPVLARDALIYSRNVPTVRLTARLAEPDFHGFLARAGIGGLQEHGHYGLSIALGGVEVTMVELAELYATLANEGVQRRLAVRADQTGPRAGRRLLSPEASFITVEMLARNPRPGAAPLPGAASRQRIPWKTGTSYAFRDAWSVGLVGPYVVAVWTGNFDGEGDPALVGSRAAAPLFFELADALDARLPALAPFLPGPAGLDVRRVSFCAPTGDLPGRHCPRMDESWFIPGVSPIKVSDIYRPVEVDVRSGLRACPGSEGETRTEVYAFWPSDLRRLFRQAGLPRRRPPPYEPGCRLADTGGQGAPPEILTPQSTLSYGLRPDRLAGEAVPFTAVADADARRLYWFVDGDFAGRSRPGEPLFWRPRPGEFRVRVVDDLGRAAHRTIRVTLMPGAG